MNSEEESKSITEAQISEKYDVFDVVCPYCGKTSFGVLLKPNTKHRIICSECKHTTYVIVLEDLSIQMYKEDEVCPECHGTGYVTCPMCGGDGYLVYISLSLSPSGEDKQEKISRISKIEPEYGVYSIIGCPQCGGSKSYWIRSPVGSVPFPEVLDQLSIALTKISKGTGKVKCSKCGGIGFVASNKPLKEF